MRLVLLVCSLLAVAWAEKDMCPKRIERPWGEVVSHHLSHVHTVMSCKHACLFTCIPTISLNCHLAQDRWETNEIAAGLDFMALQYLDGRLLSLA